MRFSQVLSICAVVVAYTLSPTPALAAPPEKVTPAQLSRLINESPFTIKPARPTPGPVATPLERDWMLGSIRPGENGYSVTLINKKDRKDRVRFIPGFSSGDFQLLAVKQDPVDSSNSRVQVKKGSVTAWLTYDEKLIKVRPAAAAAAVKKAPSTGTKTSTGRTTTQRSGPPIPGQSGNSRSTRQRTVPKRR